MKNFVKCSPNVRHEIGTANKLTILNLFMGTYDMFLLDLEHTTYYKSVPLLI